MNAEFLLEAIGELDDDLIEEAEEVQKVVPLHRWTNGLAAVLAVCIGVGALWYCHNSDQWRAIIMSFNPGFSGGASDGANNLWQSTGTSRPPATPEDPFYGHPDSSSSAASGDPSQLLPASSSPTTPSSTPEDPGQDPGSAPGDPQAGMFTLGETVEELPEGSLEVGSMPLHSDGTVGETGDQDFTICPMWQDPEGRRYLQLPEGGWAELLPLS